MATIIIPANTQNGEIEVTFAQPMSDYTSVVPLATAYSWISTHSSKPVVIVRDISGKKINISISTPNTTTTDRTIQVAWAAFAI